MENLSYVPNVRVVEMYSIFFPSELPTCQGANIFHGMCAGKNPSIREDPLDRSSLALSLSLSLF
jgi:hypothetical protein